MAGRCCGPPPLGCGSPIHPCRRYKNMIAIARKSGRKLLLVLLLMAMLGLSPLLGVRAPAAASHSGVIAMKCVCG